MLNITASLRRYLLPVLALALVFSPFSLHAADGELPEQMTILETIMHGGPLIMMIWVAILATSVIMVTFIIQLFLVMRVDKLAPRPLVESIRATLDAGNYQEAWEVCRANKTYLANVLGVALERLGRGKDAVETSLIEQGLREASILKTQNSYLSVIGVVAPMIGLLGTVIGMMGAFAVLGQAGVSDPRKLALSIGEVLMATASGLFIAIPAFIFYYYFRNLSMIVIGAADDKIMRLVEDIPFDELGGVRIGESFSVGEDVPAAGAESRKVSMALTTNCPVCNGAINAGQNPCPHCGATLDWA